ncbi:hypothetical protein ABPG72_021845 [Tetrahymena utriculariae]
MQFSSQQQQKEIILNSQIEIKQNLDSNQQNEFIRSDEHEQEQNDEQFNTNQTYQANQVVKYNEIFVFGSNKYGQIGLSEKNAGKNFCIPRFCHFNIVFTSVSCGSHHSILLTQDGYAYSIGSNIYGQLGADTNQINYSYTPTLIQKLQDYIITKVVSGAYHNIALTNESQLFSWGRNNEGQLGLGTLQAQCFYTPQQIQFDKKIINVFSGWNHSFFITKQNELFSFGSGLYGQLGQGKCENSITPDKVLYHEKNQKIIKIACGETHSLLLTEQGQVFACGENQRGQLGLGRNKKVVLQPQYLSNENLFASESIVDIACGRFSVAITQKTQSLYAWGQICDTDSNPIYTPQLVFTFNSQNDNLNKEKQQINHVKKAVVGGDSCIVLMKNGDLYSWGKNKFGECGQGDFENKSQTFYPINFLKGKKVLTFHLGEAHAIVLGREVYSRNLAKMNNSEQFSNCNSQHEVALIEKSQSFICSDYMIDNNNEASNYSVQSSQYACQNNTNQNQSLSDNGQQNTFNHSRSHSFQQNQSTASDKDALTTFSQQKFQFQIAKTPNFLNENSSQFSQQYNSRQNHNSNQREKLSIVVREIERTHSPTESSTKNTNIQYYFNFGINQNNSYYGQDLKNKQEFVLSPKNQLQQNILKKQVNQNHFKMDQQNLSFNQENQSSKEQNLSFKQLNQSFKEQDIGLQKQSKNFYQEQQHIREDKQSTYEITQSESEANLDQHQFNLSNQKNNFFGHFQQSLRQVDKQQVAYFISDKAPNYFDQEIKQSELNTSNQQVQEQNLELNRQSQQQNTGNVRFLTPQPTAQSSANYETFSYQIGDQFINFPHFLSNTETINSNRQNQKSLSNQDHSCQKNNNFSQQAIANNNQKSLKEISQDKIYELPLQMKQVSIDLSQNNISQQNRTNKYHINNSEKSVDTMCSTQNPLILQSQEFSENKQYYDEKQGSIQGRNQINLCGQKFSLENIDLQLQLQNNKTNEFKFSNLNDKLNQMNSAFQGLIKKLALENNEINEQILKSLTQTSTTSKQLDERSNNTFTSSGKVLVTNPSDASMAIVENQNFFTLETNPYTNNSNQNLNSLNPNLNLNSSNPNQNCQQNSHQNFSRDNINRPDYNSSQLYFQQEQNEIELRNNLMHHQFEKQQKSVQEYLKNMKSCQQNVVEKQIMQQCSLDENEIHYFQQKELIDQEIYRQQQELQEILFQQNSSILSSISKFRTEYQELQNDVNIQNKVKKLEQLLAKTEESNHQQEQNQKRKLSGSEKENSQNQNKLNSLNQNQPYLQQQQKQILQTKTNVQDQKFDTHIQSLSIYLSQKERDVADLQLNLADKEVQISALQLKSNIQQLQNEQMKEQLEKALSIIENFQLFSNNFAKLRK